MQFLMCYILIGGWLMNWDSRERRRFVRIKFPCEITIGCPQKHIISTHAEDISAGGIRVIAKEKIEPSSIIGLDLYGIAKEPIVCKGEVKWVSAKKNPSNQNRILYDVGIEFCQIKEEDAAEIKKLIVSIISGEK